MEVSVLAAISKVLTNIHVITATVVILLYLNFVVYVVRYRKKPPRLRNKKNRQIETSQKTETSETGQEAASSSGKST